VVDHSVKLEALLYAEPAAPEVIALASRTGA